MSLVLIMLAATLAYVPGIPSAAVTPRWTGVAVIAALGTWTISAVRMTPGHWFGLALIVWALIGLMWSASPVDSVGAILQLMILAMVFCLAADHQDLGRAWLAFVIGANVNAAVVVAQWATGHDLVSVFPGGGYPGLFFNRDMASEVLALGVVVAICQRLWWAVPGSAAGLLIAGGRGASITLMIMGVVWIWRRRSAWWLLAYVPLIVWAAGVAATMSINTPSLIHRLEIWKVTIDNLTLAGWGIGTFAELLPEYEYAHSEPLHLAFELGVGSVFAIMVFVDGLVRGNDVTCKMALAAVAGFAAVSFPLHMPATAVIAAMCAGHLCGSGHRLRAAQPARRADDPSGAVSSFGYRAESTDGAFANRIGPLSV